MNRKDIIKKGTLFYLLLLALMVIGTILLTPEIIYVLGGEKYIASVNILPGLVFAVFIQSITSIFTIILTYDKNVVKTAIYTGFFAMLSIVTKIWLLPEHGLMVLVYINIAVFSILFLINYLLVRHAGYADVISFKGMILFLLVTGIVTAFNQSFYGFSILRYAFISILALSFVFAMIKHRNQLLTFVNGFKSKRNK